MTILKYDTDKCGLDQVQNVYFYLKEHLDEDIIAIPKEWDILLDCSTSELYNLIEEIENIIRKKEFINES